MQKRISVGTVLTEEEYIAFTSKLSKDNLTGYAFIKKKILQYIKKK